MILRTEHLVKKYSKRIVVDDVSIQVGQGEIVGLLGPNGAGKTTTFYMVVGLVKPLAGEIFLNEQNIPFKREFKIWNVPNIDKLIEKARLLYPEWKFSYIDHYIAEPIQAYEIATNVIKEADVIIAPKTEKKEDSTALSIVRPYLKADVEILKLVLLFFV